MTSTLARPIAPRVLLDADQLAQMERFAPAALARRDRGYFLEQSTGAAEMLIVGALSLAALHLWESPPHSMLLLLLASCWIGIFGEVAKFVFLRGCVLRELDTYHQDNFVWAAAAAIRWQLQRVPHDDSKRYLPGWAMFADILPATVATAMIVLGIEAIGGGWSEPMRADPTPAALLVLIGLLQAAAVGFVIVRHRRTDIAGRAPPRFAAGVRGMGLWALMFLILIVGDAGRDLHRALSWANLALVGFGTIWMLGLLLRVRETRWLRNWLRSRPTTAGAGS